MARMRRRFADRFTKPDTRLPKEPRWDVSGITNPNLNNTVGRSRLFGDAAKMGRDLLGGIPQRITNNIPAQEFFDTYGEPMRGNIEIDSLAYPGTKFYGLGDRLTKEKMLLDNDLINYELGGPPNIKDEYGIPIGYELDSYEDPTGPIEDRWMTPDGSRPMLGKPNWKPFWDYITGGLFKTRCGIASLYGR